LVLLNTTNYWYKLKYPSITRHVVYRRNRHIQERDERRLARELGKLKEDEFDTWITVEQDQEQDQDQDTGNQDTRPQKRQYSSETLDSDRRCPLRKRQLTAKAAALIIE
jgi:hypothetical protein